jgi:hypothetical protein
MKGKRYWWKYPESNDTILNSILSKTDFVIKDKITDSKVLC